MKDIVIDDKVNYLKRNPSLVDNERSADLNMITRRIFVNENFLNPYDEYVKKQLHEFRELREINCL